jgi:ribonuclease HI
VPSKHKSACLSALHGTFPTPAWLWAHGWDSHNECSACGQTDDLIHVVNGCGPPTVDPQQIIAKALKPLAKPEVFDINESIVCTINGWPVNCEDFMFDPDLPIYTDGSAKDIGIEALAVSAGAAFQIGKNGKQYVAYCQVPRSFPQSAVSAEHMAIHIAFRHLPQEGKHRAIIVSDCQAIVSAFKYPHLHEGYRAKYGGLWREKGLAAVHDVQKTPAHRTKEEAVAQNDEANWFGNDKADYYAKHALAGTGKDGSDYKKARKDCLFSLGEISSKLAEHLHPEAIAILPRVRTGSKTRTSRSEHHFIKHLNHWACIKCGCFKKAIRSRQDKTSCVDRAKLQGQIHSTHRIFCGHYEVETGIPNFSFCVLCGCYSSQKLKKLKEVCRGTRAYGKETIRSRLALKQHPITLKPIGRIRRMLLASETRPLADMVKTIVNKTLPADLSMGVALNTGICHPDASGEDFSMGEEEFDDPFLDIAHV